MPVPETTPPAAPPLFDPAVQTQAPDTTAAETQAAGQTAAPVTTDTEVPLFNEENSSDLIGGMQDFQDKAPGVTEDQTVLGQMGNVLNKDNALFDYARGAGAAYANSRGLQNSDIGAQASSQAVFDVALPIAQQDAATYADRAQQEAGFWQSGGLMATQGSIDSILSAQGHMQTMVQQAQQGDINSRLQLEQFGYNWDLSEQDNLNRLMQLSAQGDIDASLALQQFGFDTDLMNQDFGYRIDLQNNALTNDLHLSEVDHQEWLEQNNQQHQNTLDEIAAQGDANNDQNADQFTRDLQANYLTQTGNRISQYSAEVQAIYSREGLTSAQQRNAINVARGNMEDDLAMYADYYSSNPYWDPAWTITGGSVTTPDGGTTTPPGGIPPDPVIPPVGPGPDDPVVPRRFRDDALDGKYPDRRLDAADIEPKPTPTQPQAAPPVATQPPAPTPTATPAPAPAPTPIPEQTLQRAPRRLGGREMQR